jgi:uncharacterized membrane protein
MVERTGHCYGQRTEKLILRYTKFPTLHGYWLTGWVIIYLSLWTGVLVEKKVTHLVKKFPAVNGTEGLLLCSQEVDAVPFLSQMNPVQIFKLCFFKIILILIFHQCLGVPCGLFPSGFPIKILCTFLIFPKCYMPGPSHLSWFNHS